MELPSVAVKRILYATDLSWNARLALSWSLSLADKYQAELVILHVMEEDPDLDRHVSAWVSDQEWQDIKARNEEETRQLLIGKRRGGAMILDVINKAYENAKAEADLGTFASDEIVLEKGNAVQKILEVADRRQCDLIVMGSHGHGTFIGAMMGSTAQRVLRHAKKPVMVIRLPS